MLQQIRAVFNYAIRKKLCYENPAQYLLLEDYAKFCNLTTKANESRSFSNEEIETLRNYCLDHIRNPHAIVMLVAMETGLRAAELPALLKTDITEDFIYVHRQQIKVPKTDINSELYFTDVEYTKNERSNPRGGRPVPITTQCQKALDLALSLAGESKYVFHHPDGRPVIKDSYESYLRRVCSRLGIETSHNHAFRVAFNTRLISAGVDGTQRCLILGHSMQTNERHYSFSDRRQAEEVRDKLNSVKKAI
ncbi:MAG: tyrosine-type recombinase/integrase [Saccharofermentans sp.]|nr:tyrosine-type recombinase/integrase [Saccharofermentans sp.]